MFLVGILSWWYRDGWSSRYKQTEKRLGKTADNFSIGLLASSLFAPFRQISAGKVSGPIAVQMRAWADRTISRVIGALIRSVVIIAGIIVMLFQALVGIIEIILWPIVPVMPVVGLILMVTGWVPVWPI